MSRAMKRPASALPESTSVKSVARLLFGPKRIKVSEDTREDSEESSEEDSEEYTEEDIEDYTEEESEEDSEWDIERPTEDYTAYWPSWYLDIYNEIVHMEMFHGGWSECSSEYEGSESTEDAESAEELAEDTEPVKTTEPAKDPNCANTQDLRQGAPVEPAKPLKTLEEINVDDAKNRDGWRLQLNNQKIRRSADPRLERQIILAKNATELVSKTYELLEQTPRDHRPIIWLKRRYDLFCEDHARLFAKTDEDDGFGEYEHGDTRTVKFIRISDQQLKEGGMDERDVPPCGGGQIFQADIRICGGLRGTKLFSIIYANPEPTVVGSWSMGDLAFTFIEDHFFKLRIPRDKVLQGTKIDPSKAPEFFEFVGISKEYQSA